MKATLNQPPPQPQPPATVTVEMSEREATVVFGILSGMSGDKAKAMLDGANDDYVPNATACECGTVAFDFWKALKKALKINQ